MARNRGGRLTGLGALKCAPDPRRLKDKTMKKTLTMNVSFNVDAAKLGLFTDLLQNEVTDLVIRHNSEPTKARHARSPRTDGAKSIPEVMADLCADVGKGGTVSAREGGNARAAMKAAGLAETSCFSGCSSAAKSGLLSRTGKGTYRVL